MIRFNKKFKYSVFSMISAISVMAASLSTVGCWPYRVYQPEIPKALIKED